MSEMTKAQKRVEHIGGLIAQLLGKIVGKILGYLLKNPVPILALLTYVIYTKL